MICAESYLVCSTAMSLISLPLGGKMAGLPTPSKRTLSLCAAVVGLLSAAGLRFWPLSMAALPGGIALCFRRHGFPACMRCALTTLFSSFLLGGAMTAAMNAGIAAVPSALIAAGLGITAFLLLTLLPQAMRDVRQVELRVEDNAVILPAMLDSGNLLRDPVTGLPVLVVPGGAARVLFPGIRDLSLLTGLPLGFRLLSVRTAAGSALLPMFRPDSCRIYVNGKARDAELLVAVAGRDYGGAQALVPLSAVPSF